MTRSEEDAMHAAARAEEALQNAERVIVVHVGTSRVLNSLRQVGLGYTVAWQIGGIVHLPWDNCHIVLNDQAMHVVMPYTSEAVAKLDRLMGSMMTADSLLYGMAASDDPLKYLMAMGEAQLPSTERPEWIKVYQQDVAGGVLTSDTPLTPSTVATVEKAVAKARTRRAIAKAKATPAPEPDEPAAEVDAATMIAIAKAQQARGDNQAALPLEEDDDNEI